MEWGSWGECEDGKRQRAQYVAIEKVGAGKDCLAPEIDIEGIGL